MSDKVHIHDILPVNDSRNRVCRVFYLDTKSSGFPEPACNCLLPYTGEEDLLLPISTAGKNHNKDKGKTYNESELFRPEKIQMWNPSGLI